MAPPHFHSSSPIISLFVWVNKPTHWYIQHSESSVIYFPHLNWKSICTPKCIKKYIIYPKT